MITAINSHPCVAPYLTWQLRTRLGLERNRSLSCSNSINQHSSAETGPSQFMTVLPCTTTNMRKPVTCDAEVRIPDALWACLVHGPISTSERRKNLRFSAMAFRFNFVGLSSNLGVHCPKNSRVKPVFAWLGPLCAGDTEPRSRNSDYNHICPEILWGSITKRTHKRFLHVCTLSLSLPSRLTGVVWHGITVTENESQPSHKMPTVNSFAYFQRVIKLPRERWIVIKYKRWRHLSYLELFAW